MKHEELHLYYEDLVRELRRKGILCAITSGLACVHFDVAETTKDCDLLCHTGSFGPLLATLAQTPIGDLACAYRGNMTAPLEARWHRGGWTSHFCWGRGPDSVTLDVFGRALRGSTDWEAELAGLYVSPHIVSEMKRTNRDKDWPFISALGARMIEAGDPRGWLHLFDLPVLHKLLARHPCPDELVARRPALGFARDGDKRALGALNAERQLWEQLDELRIRIYQRAVRRYLVAVRKAQIPETAPLLEQHAARVSAAGQHLPESPLKDHGLERLVAEARQTLVDTSVVPAEAFAWVPDITPSFHYLLP